jgi:hypothetical protein
MMCVLECAYDSEEREYGVDTGVNDTMVSETPTVISLVESVTRRFGSEKKP